MTQAIAHKATSLVSDIYSVAIVLAAFISWVASIINNKYVIAVFSGLFVVSSVIGIAYDKLLKNEQ